MMRTETNAGGRARTPPAELAGVKTRTRPRRWLADVPTAFSLGLWLGVLLIVADEVRRRPPKLARVTAGAVEAVDLPPHAWRGVLLDSVRRFNQDSIPATAAGITFYMLLAIFPGLAAFVSLYGLVADVSKALQQIRTLGGVLPAGAVEVLRDQLTRLAAADHGALGIAFIASLVVSIWSAKAGATALINGFNIAYEAHERRGLLHLTLLSLGFTAGGILIAVMTVAALVDANALLAHIGLGWLTGLTFLRWPIVLVVIVLLLSVLYRCGPDRRGSHWRWITPGGLVAALAWLVMSQLFSAYVANFGHYDRTYGSLGAIVGFLTWIWLSLMVVLYGAELNTEIERVAAQRQRTAGRLA